MAVTTCSYIVRGDVGTDRSECILQSNDYITIIRGFEGKVNDVYFVNSKRYVIPRIFFLILKFLYSVFSPKDRVP